MCRTQCIRTIRKKMNQRKATAERSEIPRAVHIRDCLEQADHADAEHGCDYEIGCCSTDKSPAFDPKRREPDQDRSGDDAADRPSSAGMDKPLDPEVVGADPLDVRSVKEQRFRDRNVQIAECKEDRQWQEQRYRPAHCAPPELAGHRRHQKDFLVSIKNCIESMPFLRLSGNATSKCRILPSPERALPSRRPMPTSVSHPSGAAA